MIMLRRYQYCISGAMNNIVSNGTIRMIIIQLHLPLLSRLMQLLVPCHWYGMYIRYVIPNRTHTNDNNTTIPSSSLLVVAVTVAVTLTCVQCVYSTYSGTTNNHSHAGQVRRIMYTNDNNTSTPSSSFSAVTVTYPWIRHNCIT